MLGMVNTPSTERHVSQTKIGLTIFWICLFIKISFFGRNSWPFQLRFVESEETAIGGKPDYVLRTLTVRVVMMTFEHQTIL